MKRFLALIITAALFVMSFPAYAAGTQYAVVETPTTDGSVYVRRVAGAGQPIVGAAKYGDKLIILKKGNTWHKVKVIRTGVSGYMYGRYIRFTDYVPDNGGWDNTAGGWNNGGYVPDASVKDKDEVINRDGTIRSSDGYANFRWGPGTNHGVIDRLYNGATVWALEKNGDWYRCQTKDGRIGYINKGLLKLGDTSSFIDGESGTIRSSDGFAAVRSGAGTSHSMLYTLSVGQTTAAYGSSGQWLRINSYSGWGNAFVHRSLVRFLWSAKTTGNVHVRTGPGTNHQSIGVLSVGTPVKVLASNGSFARVDTGNAIAYVSVRYLSF